MAARWSPPGNEGGQPLASSRPYARETKILMGLTLALFCALILLGSARARTRAMLDGDTDNDILVVDAGYGSEDTAAVIDEVTVNPETVDVEGSDDIDALRLAAQVAEANGDPVAGVEIWKLVVQHPDSGLDDFLSLAKAQENAGNLLNAAETLTRACNRFPDQPELYVAFGELRETQDNPEAARFQYQVGLSYCPDSEELQNRLTEVDRVLNQDDGNWPPDWINDPEVPEVRVPEPVVEPESDPVVVYETEAGPEEVVETVQGHDVEPVNIFQAPEEEETEVNESEGDNLGDEPNHSGLVTLIGSPDIGEEDGVPEPVGDLEAEVSEIFADVPPPEQLVIYDISVVASEKQVTIEVETSSPAMFSTSRGIDAPRLFVRIPDAKIAEDQPVPRNINVNVPLVERISVVENSDTNSYVSVVIYIDPKARHSVAAVGGSLIITISSA